VQGTYHRDSANRADKNDPKDWDPLSANAGTPETPNDSQYRQTSSVREHNELESVQRHSG